MVFRTSLLGLSVPVRRRGSPCGKRSPSAAARRRSFGRSLVPPHRLPNLASSAREPGRRGPSLDATGRMSPVRRLPAHLTLRSVPTKRLATPNQKTLSGPFALCFSRWVGAVGWVGLMGGAGLPLLCGLKRVPLSRKRTQASGSVRQSDAGAARGGCLGPFAPEGGHFRPPREDAWTGLRFGAPGWGVARPVSRCRWLRSGRPLPASRSRSRPCARGPSCGGRPGLPWRGIPTGGSLEPGGSAGGRAAR